MACPNALENSIVVKTKQLTSLGLTLQKGVVRKRAVGSTNDKRLFLNGTFGG